MKVQSMEPGNGTVAHGLRASIVVGILVAVFLLPACESAGGGGGTIGGAGDTVMETDTLGDTVADTQGDMLADTQTTGPTEVLEKVTVQLTPSMSGEVTTTDGAAIQIPAYAIPAGAVAMEFTVEHLDGHPGTVPEGQTAASDVYSFGPGHFTFAQSVRLTLPVEGDPNPEEVSIWRIDPETMVPERYPGTYNPATGMVSTQTRHLSDWYATIGEVSESTADAAFQVTNTSATNWLNLYVTSFVPAYPDQGGSAPAEPISVAPSGTIGWSSTVQWYLQQGTYDLCVESLAAGTVSTPPGEPSHILVTGLTLDQAWTHDDPVTTDLSYGDLPDAIAGSCDSAPQASEIDEVFVNSNVMGVINGPTAPTVFTLDKCYYISRYATYHWNDGLGMTPGTIALEDEGGTTYGPWQTFGTPGQGGTVDAYWNCYPDIVLPKGTYTMIDSDPSTWAQNSGTEGTGMAWLEGIEVDCP